MTSVYRLFSSRFPTNSGKGAALYGGRWNPIGTEVVYAAQSLSLAALEILVHYAVLPKDFMLTEIVIPDGVRVLTLEPEDLPPDWDSPLPIVATQTFGDQWIRDGLFPVLSVPSSIVHTERNFRLNVVHPDFAKIEFLPSTTFEFDPRLK